MKIESVTTTFPNNKKTTDYQKYDFQQDAGEEENVINLYPEMEEQRFEGFGGAFTDSAGYIYACLNKEQKAQIIDTYFSENKMNYQFGRIHLDSCDFSLHQYEALSQMEGNDFTDFSLNDTERYILPFLMDVQKETGRTIEIMVSPWSPPAFMKTNHKRIQGGKLLKEYHVAWAEYICKYIEELTKRGCTITRMSLQNEPNAVQTWDSCIYTPEEEKVFLRDYMYPALVKNGLEHIEIFIWDHNKERAFERACTIIDPETSNMVAGIAFHWYSGDHFEALELIRKKFPDKKLILSEACIEYTKYKVENYLQNAQKYAHDIIGNCNAGMNAFYDWNLLLNEEGGPNHVKNYCDAPYMLNRETRTLEERNTLTYLWHFSHFIQPNSIRIGYSKYTQELEMTAFKNPDGSISCIILNVKPEEKLVRLRIKGKITSLKLKGESISTLVITR